MPENKNELVSEKDTNYFLDTLRADPEDEEFQEQVDQSNPLDLCPTMKVGRTLDMILQDQVVLSEKELYVIPVYVGARRSLWPPDEGEYKRPMCSTGIVSAAEFSRRQDRGIGFVDTGEGNPINDLISDREVKGFCPDNEGTMNCDSCPFNRYESAGLIGRGGRGKACSERRILALIIVQPSGTVIAQGKEWQLFERHHDVEFFTIADFSSTSIGAITSMQTFATSRRLRLSNMVFKLSTEEKKVGKSTYYVIKQSFAGFPDRKLAGSLASERNYGRDILFSMNRSRNEAAASAENSSDEEVPF